MTDNPPSDDEIASEEKRLLEAARQQMVNKAKQQPTTKFAAMDKAAIPMPHLSAFGIRVGDASSYQILPTQLQDSDPATPRWRIELHGLSSQSQPLGLDILGDAVLGRGVDEEVRPDLDLDPYGAIDKGVSRRHAVLRPSKSQLYLIDLGSTNGTLANAVPITNGQARALKHGDTITLGKLSFEIKIIDTPR